MSLIRGDACLMRKKSIVLVHIAFDSSHTQTVDYSSTSNRQERIT